jgi:(hydroxyamino)benzene mutase
MDVHHAERGLIRAGFILFLLALLTGFAIPAFTNHRMALAAHVGGVLNALILIAVGLSWGLLTMGASQAKLTRVAFLVGAYANWFTACLAAAWGTSKLTPLSGAGYTADPWKEGVVQALQVVLSVVMVVGAVSVIHALRSPRVRV